MKKKTAFLIAILFCLSLTVSGTNSSNVKNGVEGSIIIITPPVKISDANSSNVKNGVEGSIIIVTPPVK